MSLPATYENVKPYLHLFDFDGDFGPCGDTFYAHIGNSCTNCQFSNGNGILCNLSNRHEGYPAFLTEIQTYRPELFI